MTPRRNDPRVFVGGLTIPLGGTVHGVKYVGAPGTGKTLMMKRLYRDVGVACEEHSWLDFRQVNWDPKRDFDGMVPYYPKDFPFFDVDPFSQGKDVLDFLGDCRTVESIAERWEALITVDPQEHQKYFPEKARQLAAAVETCLFLRAFPYTERDIIIALKDVRKMRLVLSSHPYGEPFLIDINETEGGLAVLSHVTLAAHKFNQLAALNHHNKRGRRVTNAGFQDLRRGGLILPYHDDKLAVVKPLNRLALKRQESEVLARNEAGAFNLFALDECSLLDQIRLDLFAIKAREAGGILVMAWQSDQHCEHQHGKDYWRALAGQLKWTVVFHLSNPYDAELAAKYLLTPVHWHKDFSEFRPWIPDCSFVRPVSNVTTTSIMRLPVPSAGNPYITGFVNGPIPGGPWYFRIPIRWLLSFFDRGTTPSPRLPRPPAESVLPQWTSEDYLRLGLEEPDKE